MRLISTIYWNVLLQFRNGLYYVSAFFVLVMVALLRLLPTSLRLDLIMPVFLLLILIMPYFFVAAMILLEKDEHILSSLAVTPLRANEYLLGKVLSLALISLLESLVILVLSYGLHFQPVLLLLGVVLFSSFSTLIGFAIAVRFNSLNEYLLPGGSCVALLFLPLVDTLGLWQSPLFFLHPAQPFLVLLSAAFLPVPAWEIIYGLAGSLCWIGLSFLWSQKLFTRFVIRTA